MEAEQRHDELGAKPKNTPSRGQKDRSLQDIDKDIENIWNELKVLEGPSATTKLNRYKKLHINEFLKIIFSVFKVLSKCQSLCLKSPC